MTKSFLFMFSGFLGLVIRFKLSFTVFFWILLFFFVFNPVADLLVEILFSEHAISFTALFQFVAFILLPGVLSFLLARYIIKVSVKFKPKLDSKF